MTQQSTRSRRAREAILKRLRTAQPGATPLPPVRSFYATIPSEDHATRVARLVMNLTNAMAEVHRTTRDGLAAALVALVRDKQLSSVALGPELMDQATICHPLGAVTQIIPVTTPDAERDALFESVSAGLTLSRAAIAETGTIVLWMSAQSPRLLSLVPPIHIVIVEGHTVHDTLFDLMQQASWADGLPTNVILVSSPSKTADIQQTLAYGAHGPKQLIVILVEDTP